MAARITYSGLVVAGVGFFLTRFTVTLALDQDPMRFYLSGLVPLVLGLGLAAFGVALAVADVDPSLVRTTAAWCVVGTGTMLVLVVITLLGSGADGMADFETVRSRTYLSNFLIGGSVGGTLTGLYAARNQRQRAELRRQTDRLAVLNGLLRHEVLNAVTAIRGYAALGGDPGTERGREARGVVERRTDGIEATIEEVKILTESAVASETPIGPVDLGELLAASVRTVRERHPDANISVDGSPVDATVLANDRLERVFTHLIENAVVHTPEGSTVEVSATASETEVGVAVSDDGAGLPERERRLLESGDVAASDKPGAGFGLNLVRFLVESYGGRIETGVDDAGTTVTVALRRAPSGDPDARPLPTGPGTVRPAIPHLVVTFVAAVIAGAAYGASSTLQGGSVAGIGVFYGAASPVVGWITHEFHSVVFGFVFAGLVSLAPTRYRTHLPAHLAIGVAWGIVLWAVAAGVVAPVWLRLLDVSVPIPNLGLDLFVNHVVWGAVLGVLTATGYERATPWVTRVLDRLGRSPSTN